MADQPNPADFSRDDREGEYTARINVRGTIEISIKAASAEDARRQAETEIKAMEKEGFVEIDHPDEIELDGVYKDLPMFRVTRDGKSMQVSRLSDGDKPRAPDENGF